MSERTVTFFHDVVCGWCYVLSPRLRVLASEYDLTVEHRVFTLQDSREAMIATFGSMERAKATILGHWEQCARADELDRIDVEGMRRQPFEYPNGLPGAIACKAAEAQGGQAAHWDMFDRVQHAHLTENRNVASADVLRDVAADIGLAMDAFDAAFESPRTRQAVRTDQAFAREMAVRSVPTLIFDGRCMVSGAQTLDALRSHVEGPWTTASRILGRG